jgi:hypothetical protein
MANQSITAANVAASASAVIRRATAGGALTRGQPAYLDATDGNSGKAGDADAAASAQIVGIVLQDVADGQPFNYVVEDPDFDPGFSATAGEIYVLSATAGGICLVSDLGAGDYVTVLMIGKANGNVVLRIINSGATVQAP